MNLKKTKIKENLQDLHMLNNLEIQLERNHRISLPELSNFNHNAKVEFDPISARGRQGGAGVVPHVNRRGVQWHEIGSLDNVHRVDNTRHQEHVLHPQRRAIT